MRSLERQHTLVRIAASNAASLSVSIITVLSCSSNRAARQWQGSQSFRLRQQLVCLFRVPLSDTRLCPLSLIGNSQPTANYSTIQQGNQLALGSNDARLTSLNWLLSIHIFRHDKLSQWQILLNTVYDVRVYAKPQSKSFFHIQWGRTQSWQHFAGQDEETTPLQRAPHRKLCFSTSMQWLRPFALHTKNVLQCILKCLKIVFIFLSTSPYRRKSRWCNSC